MNLFVGDTSFDTIIEEQHYLSKKANISICDSNNMPDFERQMHIGYLCRDIKKEIEANEQAQFG